MTRFFTPRKQAVRSRRGVVASQNVKASQAGARVLAAGGNAMDAAVTTALVLSVVEPWLSGVGGGGFLLHADGESGEVATLDFNVRSPRALDPADYPLASAQSGNWFNWPSVVGGRNVCGYMSVCTPGAVAGFAAALHRFGTISWADALQPAIEHAERGLEIDWHAEMCIAAEAPALARDPATAAVLLDGDAAPRSGWKPMPAKARMLRRLAQAGARDFYEGETAAHLVRNLAAGGSKISLADLTEYQPQWRAPLKASYGGASINCMDGLSGGPSLAEALERLTATRPRRDASDADWALAYAEAIRAAYQSRLTRMGHAATPEAGCTSHVSVVDERGTMTSLTNTLLSRFGARVTPPDCGFLLNNGMMWFDPRPGQPNSIAPGAQPLANMCPLILSRDHRPWLAIGAAGGRTIFPTLAQLLSFMIDRGYDLEDAFHLPRIDASAPTIRVNTLAEPDVAARIGSRFPVEIVEDTLYPVHFSVPSAVMRDLDSGAFIGMAHPNNPWAAAEAAPA